MEIVDKFKRLMILKILGFNTPDAVVIYRNEPIYKAVSKILSFYKKYEKLSIRTFLDIEDYTYIPPHFPNLDKNEALLKTLELLSAGYNILLQQGVRPTNGNDEYLCLVMKTGSKIIIEMAKGPGTVRKLTIEGKIDDRFEITSEEDEDYRRMPTELQYIYEIIKECELDNVIFEVSIYREPVVGHNREVFWGFTKAGGVEEKIPRWILDRLRSYDL